MACRGSKNEKEAVGFFSAVFKYITDKFQIKPKELSAKILLDERAQKHITYFSENSIYNWRVRCAPNSEENFELLKEHVILYIKNKRGCKKSVSEDLFCRDMDQIFSSFGLGELWEEILGEGKEYISLIKTALEEAYENRKAVLTANAMEKKVEFVDFASQKGEKKSRLVVFDLDGTLIKGIKYSWTLLYQAVNVSADECRVAKKKFENGELSYPEWVELDCQILQRAGLTKEIAQSATRKNCSLTKNFYEAIQKLKDNGFEVAIISGGADIVLYSLVPDANRIFNGNIFINKLRFDEESGRLTDIEATPYDWDDDGKVRGVSGKNQGLKVLCKRLGIDMKNTVFVGDDDNDFKAMRIAGMKILYHSCDPNDKTMGTGCRSLPEGIALIMENDLMVVADYIISRTNEIIEQSQG